MKCRKTAHRLTLILALCGTGILFLQCSESEAPEPPAGIVIVSGDNQYSKYGTELPDPLVVKVTTKQGSPFEGATVVFQPREGGGTVSKSKVVTNNSGLAATNHTLGPTEGLNTVRAHIEEKSSSYVLFNATASYAFCQEAETTFAVSYGTAGHLFLVTPKSSLYPDLGYSGLLRVSPLSGGQVSLFLRFDPDIFTMQLWDVAFSPRGDFYMASDFVFTEILKVSPDGDCSHFAWLDGVSELTIHPGGLIVGCDENGPFFVTCRDTLLRFPEATYSGTINNDAVAVDPVTEDIYFINDAQERLLRLPTDTLTMAGPVEIVATLSTDETEGARGMVCNSERRIFILVDTEETKKILEVSAIDGAKTDLVDFFSRGSGSDAGIQRDLALDEQLDFLYTLDTLNDVLLLYRLSDGQLFEAVRDSALSTPSASGERVGLAVLK